MGDERRIRVSDDDRAVYDQALRTAYAEGRISGAELEERLTLVLEARFEDDLLSAVSDLPADQLPERRTPPTPSSIDRLDQSGSRLRRAGPFIVPPVICTAIYAMTDFGGYFWPMWVWFGFMVMALYSFFNWD